MLLQKTMFIFAVKLHKTQLFIFVRKAGLKNYSVFYKYMNFF